MQKSLTWSLLVATLIVSGFIYFLDQRIPGTRERSGPQAAFPQLRPSEADSIQVTLPSGEIVRAEKTNDTWTLRTPLYPAQQVAIENFITNLTLTRRHDRLAPHEVALQGAKAFGLEPPRATIEVKAGTNRIAFQVGGRAPLTNNIYLRLLPAGEVVLASEEVAQSIPTSANAWRDPRLVNLANLSFDHLRVRAGSRSFQLTRDPTNRAWHISLPVPARADQERVAGLLESLRIAEAQRYVSDAPGEMDQYGLQNPEIEVAFLKGTNRTFALEFGSPVTNEPSLVYARIIGNSNIVAVPRELVDLLRQPYKTFHDPKLLTLTPAALDRVMIQSTEKFVLQREGSRWYGTNGVVQIPIDPGLLGRFTSNFVGMEIVDIAKEVPTDTDLQNFGLIQPSASFSFFQKLTNAGGVMTNILFSEVSFGTNQADRIYARRSDELPVYVTPLGQFLALPRRMFELRDRHIWSIPETNIVRVSFVSLAGTNSIERTPNGAWSSDEISNAQMTEIVHRLANLEAAEWSSKGVQRKAAFGIRENPLMLRIDVQTAAGISPAIVQFGNATMRRNVYASVILPEDPEPVIFEFPGLLFHSLVQLLPPPK